MTGVREINSKLRGIGVAQVTAQIRQMQRNRRALLRRHASVLLDFLVCELLAQLLWSPLEASEDRRLSGIHTSKNTIGRLQESSNGRAMKKQGRLSCSQCAHATRTF